MSENAVPDALRRGGRRWKPLVWFEMEHGDTPGTWLRKEARGAFLYEDTYEYRLAFDRDRELWRMDRRTFVPGG